MIVLNLIFGPVLVILLLALAVQLALGALMLVAIPLIPFCGIEWFNDFAYGRAK